MARTGWDGPNRKRRERSRRAVSEAVRAMGDRTFAAADLVAPSRHSVGTVRRYLDEMRGAGNVVEINGTGRKARLLYRAAAVPAADWTPRAALSDAPAGGAGGEEK